MNPLELVASFFKGGGPFMFIILGIAVLILATIAERMVVIVRAGSVNSRAVWRIVGVEPVSSAGGRT